MVDQQNLKKTSSIITSASTLSALPQIPEKHYFSIGEVGELCELKPYVLRYWEQEFPQLKPLKRHGNRRYYQRNDVLLVLEIKELLYHKGFTIEGAKAQLLMHKQKTMNLPRILTCLQETVDQLENILLNLKHHEKKERA